MASDPDDRTTAGAGRGAARLEPLIRWLLAPVALVVTGLALHAMTPVLVPLVFGVMIALIVSPIDRAIAERLPQSLEWLGRIAIMLILFLLLALFILGIIYCAEQLMEQIPSISTATEELMQGDLAGLMSEMESEGDGESNGTISWLSSFLGSGSSALGSWVVETAGAVTQRVLRATGTMIAGTFLVVFFVLLLLAEARTWDAKLCEIAREGQETSWQSAVATTAGKLRRWLIVRTGVGILSAGLYAGWLWLFGIDLLPVWALLTFLLTFIPNIGSVISGVLPTVYALLTRDLGTAAAVGAGLFVIEQAIGSWLDPRIQGRQIAISPVVIFAALLIWSWIWGIAGALLSTPMTIAAMVLAAHVEPLRKIALLLSDQPNLEALDRSLAR
ncbi:AI-2E family transporter [Histidinibacterium lentulum]|uniref:AI-2E family transporter n=1 Tax=Histidinibacterium lentulum TaxID=2480588 RepID=A0A3N2R8E5_9RHOB|nr:AI-2E family transporter [Histidinibacterium lentulum]ROU03752.1 AI-2E family transporter [Histidinibacterium lentulum]